MIPLFSLTSSTSWGIGEFPDLATFAQWASAAGQSFIQILPITELPESETSPYSAMTAMALDPIFIAVPAVEDFAAIGGAGNLADDAAVLEQLQARTNVSYSEVRGLKSKWLRKAFEHFARVELPTQSARARTFAAFVEEHSVWLDEYALFRAIRNQHAQLPWWEWPAPLAKRDEEALRVAEEQLSDEIMFRKYLQWIASEQLSAARRAARPVQIFGDVPFMISSDSPDVWTRQSEFRFDATVGVPPDTFSETGQDWGLPPWRWEVMRENDFAWMRTRAQRTAELFDGFRLDHLVGLYRTYMRPKDGVTEPFFAPMNEDEQIELGERLVSLYLRTGAEVIAEDLGTVPDFVRASLARLQVPGFKVLRWERRWTVEAEPYIDPSEYHPVSVATTGTHDTEPLGTWWESLDEDERADVLAMPSVARHIASSPGELDAVLRALLDARSYLAIIPLHDVFFWRDRINTPGEVSGNNWTCMLPWRVDHLLTREEPRRRALQLADWSKAADR
jgi:4-alpha-glucanotransferase